MESKMHRGLRRVVVGDADVVDGAGVGVPPVGENIFTSNDSSCSTTVSFTIPTRTVLTRLTRREHQRAGKHPA